MAERAARRKLHVAKLKEKGTFGAERRKMTLEEVENIFIEKFQEKYKLTKKDIRKVTDHALNCLKLLNPSQREG